MDEVVKALRAASAKDAEAVRRAYDYAEKAHGTELRKSGEPYIVHPGAIALTLAKLGMDRDTVIAGILHDTIEDTPTTADDIEREFGKTVRFLVESVTKLSKLKYRGLERHVESLRRLLVATANDIRVIIIKLADRLHNMETIEFVEPVEKRNRIAMETMEVYVPIAARLGIGVLKAQLEDLAFKTLESERFQKIDTYLKNESEKAKGAIDEALESLKKELAVAHIKPLDIHSRVKGIHSFAMKLERKGNDIEKVYDTFAIRLILRTEEECYRALGVIHALWRPVPGRVKDYIATAKTNGYRSIHTTILTPQKVVIEVQLRTDEMNREAQFGIASHFGYKQGPEKVAGDVPSTIVWLSRFVPSLMRTKKVEAPSPGLSPSTTRWLKELTEAAENFQEQGAFQQALKEDFFAERMFVFTPKGDVIDLPVGATPIDFAYAIHSDLGDTMMGAKVNGKIMQLTGNLKNGDVVEVITRKSAKPNRKWLEVVKTSSAKHHIRDALNRLGSKG
jgi:GTP pyrophosphokinase